MRIIADPSTKSRHTGQLDRVEGCIAIRTMGMKMSAARFIKDFALMCTSKQCRSSPTLFLDGTGRLFIIHASHNSALWHSGFYLYRMKWFVWNEVHSCFRPLPFILPRLLASGVFKMSNWRASKWIQFQFLWCRSLSVVATLFAFPCKQSTSPQYVREFYSST